jgi:hypothetical protein
MNTFNGASAINTQLDAVHPVVRTELHKQHYVFRLTTPLLVIIFPNTTCFDLADN